MRGIDAFPFFLDTSYSTLFEMVSCARRNRYRNRKSSRRFHAVRTRCTSIAEHRIDAKERGDGWIEGCGSRARRGRLHQKFNPYEYSLFRLWEGSGSSKRGVKRFVKFSRRCAGRFRGDSWADEGDEWKRKRERRSNGGTRYSAKQKKGGSRGGKEAEKGLRERWRRRRVGEEGREGKSG